MEVSNQKMVDAENEVLVLRRKHAASLRELTKELQSCKKQAAENSAKGPGASPLSQSSRTSSNSSLHRAVVANGGEDSLNDNHLHPPNHQRSASYQLSHNGDLTKESIQVREPSFSQNQPDKSSSKTPIPSSESILLESQLKELLQIILHSKTLKT